MISYLKTTILFLCASCFLAAHEPDAENNYADSFKDKIHVMCAGHHHLQPDELKKICNQFPEHFDDILDLQENPPEFRSDRYIRALSALVKNSDTLTREQKHLFYRRSYEQALKARKKEIEEESVLRFLVKWTDFLSREELKMIAETTTDEPLKKYIEDTVLKNEPPLKRGDIHLEKKSITPSEKSSGLKYDEVSSAEDDHQKGSKWIYYVVGGLLLTVIGGFLFARKGKPYKL